MLRRKSRVIKAFQSRYKGLNGAEFCACADRSRSVCKKQLSALYQEEVLLMLFAYGKRDLEFPLTLTVVSNFFRIDSLRADL